MKHPLEQDLLLHAHRALGPLQTLSIGWHLRSCSSCRARATELQGLSRAIGGALTGVAWKPAVAASLKTKLLIALIALSTVVLCGEVAHNVIGPPTNGIGVYSPCKVHAINGVPLPPAPTNRVEMIKEFARKNSAGR